METRRRYLIRMLPDEVDALTSGPPPLTLPAMRCLSSSPLIVTGCTDDTEPELVRASRSNAASGGTVIETDPDDDFNDQGPEGRPSTATVPLDVLTRAAPSTPVTRTLPEAADTDTSPLPV
jgi:hypothetical protein